MGHHPSYSELVNLSDKELTERLDQHAQNTVVGTQFYLEELSHRSQSKLNDEVRNFTQQMRDMTLIILVLTALCTLSVGYTIWQPSQHSTLKSK